MTKITTEQKAEDEARILEARNASENLKEALSESRKSLKECEESLKVLEAEPRTAKSEAAILEIREVSKDLKETIAFCGEGLDG